MLWFIFILGLNFISLCFKLIIIHYHTTRPQKKGNKISTKNKIEPQLIYVLVRHTQQNVNNEIVSENKRKIKQKKTFSVEFTGVFRQKKPRSQIVPKLKKKLITFQFFCNFRDTLLSS